MNTVYESTAIQDCKKIYHSIGGSSGEKIKIFYFLSYRHPHDLPQKESGLAKKNLFLFLLFDSCRA